MRALAALLSLGLLASTGQAETTENLLENPGAETGTTLPWGTSDGVQEGPLAFGEDVLDATEGTHWFVADEQIAIEFRSSSESTVQYLTQEVDLRGLGTLESLTLRADFFGVGEVLSGTASELGWQAEFFVTFLDEDEQVIDNQSFKTQPVPLMPTQSFENLSFSVDSVPAGTASVRVSYSGSLVAQVEPTDVLPVDVHIAIGIDDLVLTATRAPETTGNLLENPGAETGTTLPWGTSDGVQEGPLAFGEDVLDATEGTHWFVADEQIAITEPSNTSYLIHYLTQEVDLRGLGTIEGLTLRGDFFGVGTVLSGSASELGWEAEFFATFLDEDEQLIDTASFVSDPAPLGSLEAFPNLTFSVDSIPAGTASVDVQYSGSLTALTVPTDAFPVDVRIAIGIDDLVLTATTAPEPTATGSAAAALAALVALRGRIRKKR